MDPITVIIAAVVTGAATGLGSAATEGVKDAYQALKARLRARYGWDSDVNRAIEDVERSPAEGKKNLQSALAAEDAPDEATVDAAQALLAAAKVSVSDVIGADARLEGSAQRVYLAENPSGDVSVNRDVGARASLKDSQQSVQIGGQPPANPSSRGS
jgi:hypothetical protein